MKRNFLTFALAGAFCAALVGSAWSSASATGCPAGKVSYLPAGNYAFLITGDQTDTAGTPGDPAPQPIAAIGVFVSDGLCDVTGGEMIEDTGGTFSGPATIIPGPPPVLGFSGSPIIGGGGNVVGGYNYNTDNTGILELIDLSTGETFQFGVANEVGNTEARGDRINPGDPVSILIEKQPAVTLAEFGFSAAGTSSAFEIGGLGEPGSLLGLGYGTTAGTVSENLDPETLSTLVAGGDLDYNNNNGYITGVGQVFPPGGGAFVCDFNQSLTSAPSTADGTQNTNAGFTSGFGCPLSGAANETSSVLFGTGNNRAFIIVTGGNGTAFSGVSAGTAGAALESIDTITPTATLVTSVANPHPSATITITNGRGRPLNFTGFALSAGLPDVTITGGTCTSPGFANANNALIPAVFPAGTNTCTVIVTDTGVKCTPAGVTHETGTLTVQGNDHSIISCTQGPTGCTSNINCL